MWKKSLSILFILIMFVVSLIFLIPHDKIYTVSEVKSPSEFILNSEAVSLKDLESFDSTFSEHNSQLAKNLGITEEEAFVLGNLAKYWARNLMSGRKVFLKDDSDLIYTKYSYRKKFMYSGFYLKDSKPFVEDAFVKKLAGIRRAKYKVLDLDSEKAYSPDDPKVRKLDNFIVIRSSHLPKSSESVYSLKPLDRGDVRIFFADSTVKLKPDRNCSSSICREILSNINNAEKTIDMAIYGYSSTPKIEEALRVAIQRGVKVRLVYDLDAKGENIYPDTSKITNLIFANKNDGSSVEAKSIMHNKFYIFDKKVLITGSANLSHTDMSGFNSNSIIVVKSSEIAKIYEKEFEQMFFGKFHSDKLSNPNKKITVSGIDLDIYFSPQDKSITNAILPLIKNAKKYIYIPTFVLTERRVTDELISAKKRGVDVRIIIDALNASIKHSKHNELRFGEIPVKTENYAGKMHSKSMIVDDEYTVIGSMNFSYSGENRNDENLIVIKDSQITKFYKEFFLYQWSKIDDKWLKFNARAESLDSLGSCFDGIDNDYDGLTDFEDPACQEKKVFE